MDIATELQSAILSQYGLLVLLLVLAVAALWRRMETRDEKQQQFMEKMIEANQEVIGSNTKAMTELGIKIDGLAKR